MEQGEKAELERFKTTPSLTIVPLLLPLGAEKVRSVMLLDVRITFLYGAMRRTTFCFHDNVHDMGMQSDGKDDEGHAGD